MYDNGEAPLDDPECGTDIGPHTAETFEVGQRVRGKVSRRIGTVQGFYRPDRNGHGVALVQWDGDPYADHDGADSILVIEDGRQAVGVANLESI